MSCQGRLEGREAWITCLRWHGISSSSGDGRELGIKAKLGELDDKPLRPHYFGRRLQGNYAACPPSGAKLVRLFSAVAACGSLLLRQSCRSQFAPCIQSRRPTALGVEFHATSREQAACSACRRPHHQWVRVAFRQGTHRVPRSQRRSRRACSECRRPDFTGCWIWVFLRMARNLSNPIGFSSRGLTGYFPGMMAGS